MLDALPEETTQLLIDLCTTTGPLDSESKADPTEGLSPSEAKPAAPAPSYLSYLALNRDRGSTSGGAPTVVSGDKDKDNRTATPPSPSIKTVRALDRDNASVRRSSLYEVASPTSTSTPPPSAVTAHPPQTASILGHTAGRQGSTFAHAQAQALAAAPEPKKKKLSPRLYFPHFVDHMEQFVVFLETVARRRWGQSVDDLKPGEISLLSEREKERERDRDRGIKEEEFDAEEDMVDKMDQVAVWNTLLELYLTLPLPVKGGGAVNGSSTVNGNNTTTTNGVNGANSTSTTSSTTASNSTTRPPFDEKLMREKAMRVLRSPTIPYDATHALILCSTHSFTPGLVLLYEKLGMYEDVLRFYMDKTITDPTSYPDASHKVIEHLMYYGQEKGQKHLYPLVLRFLTSTPELLSRHEADVRGILEVVEDEKLMPPLGVVQVLSRNGVASVGLVKDWLVRRIKESREEIQNDQALIKSYRLETAARLKQVKDLTNTEEPRVFHVTRCSTCLGQLDLPSVHFMCNHSYHQRCIADNEAECPACAREHAVIREIRLNNQKLADQHDVFLAEVQESGFEAIATAFGRGVLNTKVEDGST
ncbi:hypothetical protein CVT26_011640 [Gymnopilus dilepis]|uniref:RING-type domain-containing protein n=1 Tax=Gymnopilus dilepis TaxID=231916 RepID=A0A409WZN0_9AGAR|nr:hypothetical protein CVT26_011640 [Gymnopilus dilepis]